MAGFRRGPLGEQPTPFNHGGSSVLSINNGGNETWVDTGGAIHQTNTGVQSNFGGSITVGPNVYQPDLSYTGYLLQINGPNTAYQPLTLGGGHAGSLNVITTPTIAAPTITASATPGSSTISYVCAGTDFDGNLINGTTATITNGAASWAFPVGYEVVCPWTAGVNTYQIYRTAGGPNQGLMGSGTGPGFTFSDFGGSASGGTPPASNSSNPHISVAGTGTPTIQLGPTNIGSGAGAPTSTCGTAPVGSGSLWLRTDGGVSTSVYSCAGTDLDGGDHPMRRLRATCAFKRLLGRRAHPRPAGTGCRSLVPRLMLGMTNRGGKAGGWRRFIEGSFRRRFCSWLLLACAGLSLQDGDERRIAGHHSGRFDLVRLGKYACVFSG